MVHCCSCGNCYHRLVHHIVAIVVAEVGVGSSDPVAEVGLGNSGAVAEKEVGNPEAVAEEGVGNSEAAFR